MDAYSRFPSTRSRLLLTTVAVSGLVLSIVGSAPAEEMAPAADVPVTQRLSVPSVESEPHLWTPSANARLHKIVLSNGTELGQVTPKHRHGRKTISLRSDQSSTAVAAAGTEVKAAARLLSGQRGRRVTLRVQEVKDGRILRSRSDSAVVRSRSWRSLNVTLRTTQPGSHLVFAARAKRVSKRHSLRVTPVDVELTTPPGVPPVPPGNPGDPGNPVPPPGDCESIDYSQPEQGRLTFTDEFNGSSLDRSVWRIRDNTFLNQDQAYIRKENVSVHDGMLDIVGKRMAEQDWVTNPQATYARNKTRDYSTGYIDTIDQAGYGNAAGNRFGQKYGYFEVTAKVPSEATMSRGIWPAFWLRADHKLGEIDPMESYGAPTIRNYDPSPSYEWNSWADTSQQSTKDHTQGTAHPKHDNVPVWKDFHRYGVNWSPTCLRYMYDGKTVGVVPLSSKPYFTGNSFDDTFHLRINMQIGTNYWGWADPEHTRPEFHYLVKSVKVYQGNALLPAG